MHRCQIHSEASRRLEAKVRRCNHSTRKAVCSSWFLFALALCAAFQVGCGDPSVTSLDEIRFVDNAESNIREVRDLDELTFTNFSGETVELKQLRDGKNLVLIFTRGYIDGICLYCTAQTTRWSTRYAELKRFDAELVVVFPVETSSDAETVEQFRESLVAAQGDSERAITFPIVLDIDLKMVDRLGIKGELSKPATYILDHRGNIRFAYVGKTISDRPSVDSILTQLKPLRTRPTQPNQGEPEPDSESRIDN